MQSKQTYSLYEMSLFAQKVMKLKLYIQNVDTIDIFLHVIRTTTRSINKKRVLLLCLELMREPFIYLDLMVKNRKIPIERYFKWWISTKLVWANYHFFLFII
jgi:hypothetical protein